MPKRTIGAAFCLLLLGSRCPPPPPPPPQTSNPTESMPNASMPARGDLVSELKIEEIPYIDDETYLADPSLLIGKIAEIRKPANDTCSVEKPEGNTLFISKVTGLKLTPPTKPELRKSVVVNRQLASSVKLLSYLSAQLDDSSVFSLIVVDESVRRADDSDPSYATAQGAWKTAHQDILTDSAVCWLVQVDGMVHKAITKRKYHQFAAGGNTGAYGVKADGKFFTSSDEYELDHRFGLSFSILRRPLKRGPAILSKDPTASERAMLARLTSIPDSTPQP